MLQRINHIYVVGFFLLVYVIVQVYCIQTLSLNYDEGSFAAYGASLLKGEGNKDIVKFESKLPVTALNMIPRAIQQVIHPGLKKASIDEDVIMGRYMSLLATVLLALAVYRWSRLLYGNQAALLSLFLFIACPNFLAHGIFVSSDIFAALFMTLCFYYCWQYYRERRTADFIWFSLFAAFAVVSKFSMLHIYLLVVVMWLIRYRKEKNTYAIKPMARIYRMLLFIGIQWLVISATHLFYGMFIPLNQYHFTSAAWQSLQSSLHGVGNYLYMPLPSSYIKSMDAVMYYDALGGGMPGSLNGATYILGASQVHGFWYYYFVVLLYKMPIPVLLLIISALLYYLLKRGTGSFHQNDMYLLIPALYFLVYMNFFYSTQVGIRHIIMIFPLLYIFTGSLARIGSSRPKKWCLFALAAWQLVSVGWYFPHFLPYTNEFITDKKMAYRKLADTNICYGEGYVYLLQYLRGHKEAVYLPDKIQPGLIVMEVNEMLNLNIATAGKYNWVSTLRPVDHIHSQYLVFQISESQADSLQKTHQLP